MDLEHSVGSIMCDNCGAKYSMRINRLTEAIDVYSEWIDSAWLPRAMLLFKPALPFHAQPCVCVLRALTCAASTRAIANSVRGRQRARRERRAIEQRRRPPS